VSDTYPMRVHDLFLKLGILYCWYKDLNLKIAAVRSGVHWHVIDPYT